MQVGKSTPAVSIYNDQKVITSSLNPCTWTPITDMMDTENPHHTSRRMDR